MVKYYFLNLGPTEGCEGMGGGVELEVISNNTYRLYYGKTLFI